MEKSKEESIEIAAKNDLLDFLIQLNKDNIEALSSKQLQKETGTDELINLTMISTLEVRGATYLRLKKIVNS